ncbi:MAG TPA: hypothetical protein VFP84_08595 [Kofleriaceae bacterium]|nr:hypothetical protein [Kofleriaceae bacterium]
MHRLLLIALCTSACGSATDDRPATLDYITETILAPTCASAECHSEFTQEVGDRFDTVSAARFSIVRNALVQFPTDVTDPRDSLLVRALRVGVPSILEPGSGNVRMPYDAPMPEADILLIERWISDGAREAQCVPNAQSRGCSFTIEGPAVRYHVIECNNGNIGPVIEDCAAGEACTVDRNNGVCVPQ